MPAVGRPWPSDDDDDGDGIEQLLDHLVASHHLVGVTDQGASLGSIETRKMFVWQICRRHMGVYEYMLCAFEGWVAL